MLSAPVSTSSTSTVPRYARPACIVLTSLIANLTCFVLSCVSQWLLVCGLLVRLLGVGLMIQSKGAHGSTAFLVITQVLQGLGGGIAAGSTQLLVSCLPSFFTSFDAYTTPFFIGSRYVCLVIADERTTNSDFSCFFSPSQRVSLIKRSPQSPLSFSS